jgi:hypothetical protein
MRSDRPSRLESVKRQLHTVRVAVAAGSVVLFGGVAMAARASHAASSSSPQPVDAPVVGDAEESHDFDFGDGSIGPSYDATPSLRTGSS